MDLKTLLDKRNALYGLCAIKIVLFHICRRIGVPLYIPVVTEFVSVGMGVEVFLFFSGLCLTLSAERNHYAENRWKGYYRKRIIRVVIPYLLIGIPFYLWSSIAEYQVSLFMKCAFFFANLTSATFWLRGTQTTWFVFAIIVYYILFPYLYRFIRRNKGNIPAIAGFLLLLCAAAFATSRIPVLKLSTILWARIPIFTIGIIAGCYYGEFDLNKLPVFKRRLLIILSFLILLGISCFISLGERGIFHIQNIYRWLLYIPSTVCLLLCLVALGDKWKPGKNGFWAKIGALSLQIYLVHVTLLHPLKLYGVMDAVGYWLYLILPVASVLIAWVFARIEDLILKNRKSAS